MPNSSFLALTEAEFTFLPQLGQLGAAMCPSWWGGSGVTPNMMVNFGHHMKVTYKVSEF